MLCQGLSVFFRMSVVHDVGFRRVWTIGKSLVLRTWISSITQLQSLDPSFDVGQFAMTLALLIVYHVYLSFDMLSTCHALDFNGVSIMIQHVEIDSLRSKTTMQTLPKLGN